MLKWRKINAVASCSAANKATHPPEQRNISSHDFPSQWRLRSSKTTHTCPAACLGYSTTSHLTEPERQQPEPAVSGPPAVSVP